MVALQMRSLPMSRSKNLVTQEVAVSRARSTFKAKKMMLGLRVPVSTLWLTDLKRRSDEQWSRQFALPRQLRFGELPF